MIKSDLPQASSKRSPNAGRKEEVGGRILRMRQIGRKEPKNDVEERAKIARAREVRKNIPKIGKKNRENGKEGGRRQEGFGRKKDDGR